MSSIIPSHTEAPKLTPVFYINIRAKHLAPVSENPQSNNVLVYVVVDDGELISIANDKNLSIKATKIYGHDKITVNPQFKTRTLDCDLFGRSPNGSTIKIYYTGLIHENSKLEEFETGKTSVAEFNDYLHFNYPQFTLGEGIEDEYKWLATNSFIGQGRFIKDDKGNAYVQYTVSLLENPQ